MQRKREMKLYIEKDNEKHWKELDYAVHEEPYMYWSEQPVKRVVTNFLHDETVIEGKKYIYNSSETVPNPEITELISEGWVEKIVTAEFYNGYCLKDYLFFTKFVQGIRFWITIDTVEQLVDLLVDGYLRCELKMEEEYLDMLTKTYQHRYYIYIRDTDY